MNKNPSHLEKLVIDNIKRIRKQKGISQERLSIFCDTSASYIGLMETYKNIPKLSTIERIADALNVEPIIFFQNSENTEQNEDMKNNLKNKLKEQVMEKFNESLDEIFKII